MTDAGEHRLTVALPPGPADISVDTTRPRACVSEPGVWGRSPIEASWATVVLAHGAGAGYRHPFLLGFTNGLAALGIATVRFNFPYLEAGRRMPGPASHAIATWSAVMAFATELSGEAPVWAAGKSYGGRMASMAAAEGAISPAGLVYLGYPLHPPGDPAKARVAHLPDVTQPQLFVEGTNDPFIDPHVAARRGCRLVSGRDHRVDRGRRALVRGQGQQASRRRDRRRARALGRGLDARPLLTPLRPVSDRRRTPACRAGWPQPTAGRSTVEADGRQASERPVAGCASRHGRASQPGDHDVAEAILDDGARGRLGARPERVHSAVVCRDGRIDRLLRRVAADEHAQKRRQLPLVLLVAAGRAERDDSALRRAARGWASAWCAAALRGAGPKGCLVEPRHLQAGAEAEPELGDRRGGLQPSARRRRRDHVAPAVDDVDVARVAAGLAGLRHGRLAGARPRRRRRSCAAAARTARARARAWPPLPRGALGDERPRRSSV